MKKTNLIIFGIIILLFVIPFTDSAISENDINELLEKGYYYFYEEKDYQESMKYFDKVILLEPNNLDALNGKGAIFMRQANLTSAEFYLDKALATNPNYIKALNNKGTLLGVLEDYEGARIYFDRALEIEPNNTTALLNKASSFTFEQNFDEAIDLLNSVLLLDSGNKLATQLKQDLYRSYGTQQIDGYLQTIVRDKGGNLIGYMETDKIEKPNHKDVDQIIKSLLTQYKSEKVHSDDGEYLLTFITMPNNRIDPEDPTMMTGSGIFWLDKSQDEILEFSVVKARFHGYLTDQDDLFSNYWQLIFEE